MGAPPKRKRTQAIRYAYAGADRKLRGLTNPSVPDEYKRVTHKAVVLGKHVIVGSGSVILPGVVLEEGVAIGALSLVTKSCAAFGVYAGNPAKWIKERKRTLLDLEREFLEHQLLPPDSGRLHPGYGDVSG